MKKILLILLITTFGFSQGNDHSSDFFSTWWKEVLMVSDTTFNIADSTQFIQDGLGNIIPMRVSTDSVRFTGPVAFDDSMSVTAPVTITGKLTVTGEISVSGTNFDSGYEQITGTDDTVTVVFWGQSNMDGVGTGGGDLATDSRVFGWNSNINQWLVADPAASTVNTYWYESQTTNYNNLAHSFAKRIAEEYNVVVRLIGRTVGGQIIGKWVGNGVNSEYYLDITNQITAAGVTEVDVIIGHHGESAYTYTAPAYLDSLTMLREQFYAETWVDSNRVKMIFGELGNSDLSTAYHTQNAVINSLQNTWQEYNVGTAPMADLQYIIGDTVHFNGTSLVIAGRERYFNTWKSLPQVPQSSSTLGTGGELRSMFLTIRGDGTYLDVSDASIYSGMAYNYYARGNGANLGKGATVGNYSLSADGQDLTIDMDAIVLGIMNIGTSMSDVNSSTTTYNYYPWVQMSSGDIVLNLYQEINNNVDHSPVDMLTVFGNGDKMAFSILYMANQ